MKILLRFWRWLTSRFQRAPIIDAAPTNQRRPRREKDHFGAHYYLGDLLDRMDEVFEHLPLLKRADPDAFDMYSRMGASIASSDVQISASMDSWFLQSRPAFGCAYLGGGDTDELVCLRFGTFTKETRPINVQPSNGDIYRLTCTYKLGDQLLAESFYVAIEGDEVRALKSLTPRSFEIPTARRRMKGQRRSRPAKITRLCWEHPRILTEVGSTEKRDAPIDEKAASLFALISNSANMRESGITVHARKGDVSAAFAIDMLRTPYFFADREKTVNENGSTKKIIHIVRGHWRNTRVGRRFVKPHFRGLREFSWNGYEIRVSMAGKHGHALSSFDVAAADPMQPEGTLTMKEVAERLQKGGMV